jgi:hypothetical protein
MPIHLADFARRQLGDAVDASAIIERRATVHVCEHKVF